MVDAVGIPKYLYRLFNPGDVYNVFGGFLTGEKEDKENREEKSHTIRFS